MPCDLTQPRTFAIDFTLSVLIETIETPFSFSLSAKVINAFISCLHGSHQSAQKLTRTGPFPRKFLKFVSSPFTSVTEKFIDSITLTESTDAKTFADIRIK